MTEFEYKISKYIQGLQRRIIMPDKSIVDKEGPNGVIENLCNYINGIYNLGWGILEEDISCSVWALDSFERVVRKNQFLRASGIEKKLRKAKRQLRKLYGRTWPECRRESLIPGRKTA